MATFAFTIVFSMVAVIDPLRENGLNIIQAVKFFFLLLPWVLSFTLPVAALFAVTFVYGRLSQERELVACRSSGISEFSLMIPAIILGTAIAFVTLVMMNFFSPWMAKNGQEVLFSQVENILFYKLENEGHFKFHQQGWILHASRVDRENKTLHGVAFGRRREGTNQMEHYLATGVRIERGQENGKTYVTLRAVNTTGPHTYAISEIASADAKNEVIPKEGPFGRLSEYSYQEDEIKCFDSPELLRMLDHPTDYRRIRDETLKLKDKISKRRFIESIYKRLHKERYPYSELCDIYGNNLKIFAPAAKKEGEKIMLSSRSDSEGQETRVTLEEKTIMTTRLYEADAGEITVYDSLMSEKKRVTVILTGNITEIRNGKIVARLAQKNFECRLPADKLIEEAKVTDIYNDIDRYTSAPDLHKHLDVHIKGRLKDKLRGEVISQLHFRNAWGVNGIVLVIFGGFIAIFFSRGHFLLTAFVLTIIPLAVTLVSMKMGERLISNPDSSDLAGIVFMWSGMVLLLVTNGVLFHKIRLR